MLPPMKDYTNTIEYLYGPHVLNFTFQVTEDCNLRCTYCYQLCKRKNYMSLDIAKRTVDLIFQDALNDDSIFSYKRNKGIIFEFIGGEPFLNIDLIYDTIKYIEEKLINTNSPWLLLHRYNISTNGTLYFTPKVQRLINDFGRMVNIAVTVDGCKELHDQCRLFEDGRGSYDLAIKAAIDQRDKFNNPSTKITLSPYNIRYLSKAVINMLDLGFKFVHANCAYEEGWNEEHAVIMYDELVKIADYMLATDIDQRCNFVMFNQDKFHPMLDEDTQNWCGGTGLMVAIDYKGIFYPCIRYMDSSLNGEAEPIIIGDLEHGVYKTCEACKIQKEFEAITRQSQSTQECIECPVAQGCAWCSAYNYQRFGTANKRATYICVMHKANALASYYFFTREAKKYEKSTELLKLYLPKDEAIRIIGQKRYDKLMEV